MKRLRSAGTTIVELGGLGAIVAGVWTMHRGAALIVAGILAIAVGVFSA